jgi:hypothetical protein
MPNTFTKEEYVDMYFVYGFCNGNLGLLFVMPADLCTSQDCTLQNTWNSTQRSKLTGSSPRANAAVGQQRPAEGDVLAAAQRIHKQNFQDDWCSTATCVDSCAPCLCLSESHSEISAPCSGASRQPSTTVCESLKPQLKLRLTFCSRVSSVALGWYYRH